MKKLISFLVAFIFLIGCNENNESTSVLNEKLLYNQFINSQQFLSLGVSKSDLSEDAMLEQTSGVIKMLIKFKNSDLNFVVGKFDNKGLLIVAGLLRVMPSNSLTKTIEEASDNFQDGKFNGDIFIKINGEEDSQFKFVNSIEIPINTTARVNGSRCGFTDSIYRIGGMGWGSRIGCFIGFIGCLFWNYIDCVTEK